MSEEVKYINPAPRYADAAIYGGVVYLAGQVPLNVQAGIADQTAEVLAKVDELLKACGSHRGRILMAQVVLKDIDDVSVMNTVWEGWFRGVTAPPRATFQAPLVNPDWLIEVIVTAAVE